VMPAAIDREVLMAAGPADSVRLELVSVSFGEAWSAEGDWCAQSPGRGTWQSYFLSVVDQFRRRGCDIGGLRVVIDGDVPHGAGLSSSAAFEVCTATLLNGAFGFGLGSREVALLSQAAENGSLVGVNCGIMDQYASALGREGKALKLDCHALEHEEAPLDSSLASILIINSMKKRGLVDSEYNTRRAQCEQGLVLLSEAGGGDYATLRHVPPDVFERHSAVLPPDVCKRVRHNLTENRRVREFARALSGGDITCAGHLMSASHESLRDDFEVSCAELDLIVEIARNTEGVHGCRMTGAGFGGCAVALVDSARCEEVRQRIQTQYENAFGTKPDCHVTQACDGASFRNL